MKRGHLKRALLSENLHYRPQIDQSRENSLAGKSHFTADLLFAWFGFDQTIKTVAN